MPKAVEFLPDPELPTHEPSPVGWLEDPRRPLCVRVGVVAAGHAVAGHAHPRAQLTIGYGGVMRLRAGSDVWFVPPRHGVWIPGGVEHQLTTQTPLEVHHLYVDPRYAGAAGLPRRPTVLRASPILRGVARRLARAAEEGIPPAQQRRLAWVAFDEMGRLERPDLHLPGGRDPRLAAIMSGLIHHPEDRRGLPEIARSAGSSERTIARLFRTETGLGFGDWRRRLRFMVALERLEAGATSAALATELGYSSPSAFIAAFRRELGAPPSAFRKIPARGAGRDG